MLAMCATPWHRTVKSPHDEEKIKESALLKLDSPSLLRANTWKRDAKCSQDDGTDMMTQ
jgi:hypothetical protein